MKVKGARLKFFCLAVMFCLTDQDAPGERVKKNKRSG